MTEAQRLEIVKIGLQLDSDEPDCGLDKLIAQKMRLAMGFMTRAGVSQTTMDTEEAMEVAAVGVADVWQADSGANFSNAFKEMVTQLTAKVEV